MKISSKLMMGSTIIISAFVLLLTISRYTIERVASAQQMALHTHRVIGKADAVAMDLINMETGERGFAVSGREAYLEPLRHGMNAFESNYNTLKILTADKPEQQELLSRLHELYRHWLATEINPLIALRKEVNEGTKPYQAVIDFIDSENGMRQMEALRSTLSQIKGEELSLLKVRQANLRRLTAFTENLIVVGGAVGILAGIAICFAVAFSINRPLREAMEYAERVRAGDFSTPLRKGGNDEIGLLLSTLQSMVGRLAEHIATLKDHAILLDLAHDAIIVRDTKDRIVFWNKGAEKTYQWSKEEVLGRTAHDILKTEFPNPLESIVESVIASGQWEGELRHRTRSGNEIIVASRWAVKRDSDNKPSGFLEIDRDITERKDAEKQINSYMKQLEKINTELENFAFMASHDLQEPLRKLSTFGGILRDSYSEILTGNGLIYLEKMLSATDRMQDLLGALLQYSRVTTRAEPFVPLDLKGLIEEVARDLEVSLKESGGVIEIEELPPVYADPSQMRQLFQNLIGNALKYHKPDVRPVVKVYGSSPSNGSCRIYVEDNGIGFEEIYLEKIFQPFQRLHGRSSAFKGSGMGLAICRKIVERHEGTITAKSKPGEGSTFIVTLPQKPSSAFIVGEASSLDASGKKHNRTA